MNGFHRKVAVPSAQLEHAIEGRSAPGVFQFRCQRNYISGIHRREVGHTKGGLMSLKLFPGFRDESAEKEHAGSTEDEKHE